MVITELFLDIGIGTSTVRMDLHEIIVVPAHYQHDHSTDDQA